MNKLVLLLLLVCISLVSCNEEKVPLSPKKAHTAKNEDNDFKTPEVEKKEPHVILISFDGYRNDYTKRFSPSHISDFAQKGVQAQGLIPIYPSLTFPNHYSIVTGMKAENHGIVQNNFYDPIREEEFHFMKPSGKDGSWYTGEPIWKSLSKHKIKSASYFWVGSDAKGNYPDYWYPYSSRTTKEERVDQVIKWLKLPKNLRPRFITLYFSDVDSQGHKYGTDSEEVKKAVLRVDRAFGRLLDGINKIDLSINIIIVSDHGMQNLDKTKVIYLDDYLKNRKGVRIKGGGAHTNLYIPDKLRRNEVYEKLKLMPHMSIYKKGNLPASLGYKKNKRVGDLVISSHSPYYFKTTRKGSVKGAGHGFEPLRTKSMSGIFYANGPRFKKNLKIKSFENIHIYPMILELFGIPLDHKIDGDANILRSILAK